MRVCQSVKFSRPQIMWLKIVCIVVIATGTLAKKDKLLDAMQGLEGRNKMSICVATASGWRHCNGVLYNREWVIVRAQCLATAPLANLTAERPAAGGSCERLAAGNWGTHSTRPALHLVMHPWFDLALVIVRTPYNDLDSLANATNIRNKLLRPHGVYRWMKSYFDAFALTRNHTYHQIRLGQTLKTLRHPGWYFFVTMLLPSVLFILFFIYVTSSKSDEVSYNKLCYSKKVTHI